MSVLLGDRKESKFEAITYSIELHDMLILLMQRGFGVKDVNSFVRKKYAYGEISEENFAKYRELMRSFKSKVNQCASLINTIYPRTMHEYETRRDYQNAAIVNCEQLINELQRVVEIFDVDLNVYNRYVKAIDREIGLIKRWRQRDMAIKSRLEKG